MTEFLPGHQEIPNLAGLKTLNVVYICEDATHRKWLISSTIPRWITNGVDLSSAEGSGRPVSDG